MCICSKTVWFLKEVEDIPVLFLQDQFYDIYLYSVDDPQSMMKFLRCDDPEPLIVDRISIQGH